MLLGEEFHMF